MDQCEKNYQCAHCPICRKKVTLHWNNGYYYDDN